MATYNGNATPDTPRNRGDYSAPHMSAITPGEDIRSVLINRVTWGPVFAGVAIMLSVQLILNITGFGIGVATFTTNTAGQWSTADVSLATTIWWTLSGIIATYAGGYAAGRLSGDPIESTAGWHGLTVWAVSLVAVTIFVIAGAGATMGGMLNTAGLNGRGLNMSAMGTPTAGAVQSANPAVTPSTPDAGNTVQAMPDQAPGSAIANSAVPNTPSATVQVTPRAAETAALFTVLALVLGAIAAWFGGRAGCIKPTITPITGPVLH